MSKQATELLKSDPERFLRSYVLVPDLRAVVMGVGLFDLTLMPGVGGRPAYALRLRGQGGTEIEGVIKAHYLPWQPNGINTLVLNDEARMFFTPSLTGCTLVIESGRNPRVSHVNFVYPRNQLTEAANIHETIQQPAINWEIANTYGVEAVQGRNPAVKIFSKAEYGETAMGQFVVAVGKKTSWHGWRFWYQKFERGPGGSDILMDRAVRLR